MDIEKDLAEARHKQKELINHINQLGEERQKLIQEALKVEGDIRTLKRLAKEASNISAN